MYARYEVCWDIYVGLSLYYVFGGFLLFGMLKGISHNDTRTLRLLTGDNHPFMDEVHSD